MVAFFKSKFNFALTFLFLSTSLIMFSSNVFAQNQDQDQDQDQEQTCKDLSGVYEALYNNKTYVITLEQKACDELSIISDVLNGTLPADGVERLIEEKDILFLGKVVGKSTIRGSVKFQDEKLLFSVNVFVKMRFPPIRSTTLIDTVGVQDADGNLVTVNKTDDGKIINLTLKRVR